MSLIKSGQIWMEFSASDVDAAAGLLGHHIWRQYRKPSTDAGLGRLAFGITAPTDLHRHSLAMRGLLGLKVQLSKFHRLMEESSASKSISV
jgi:hypothetical protein